jgi:hypothetical protein
VTLPSTLAAAVALWSGPVAGILALIALGLAVRALTRPPTTAPTATPSDERVAALSARVEHLERALPRAIQRAGLVRYDAFPGAGGQFSFSAALLDGRADGLLLTAIAGREETRLYAKWVEGGRARQALSPEEGEALARALGRADGSADAEARS